MSLSEATAEAIVVPNGTRLSATKLVELVRQGRCVWMEAGVTVDGDVDLRSVEIKSPIHAVGCTFLGEVDATDARFSRSVLMQTCIFERGLVLNHARVDGPLNLAGSRLRPPPNSHTIDFSNLDVEGRCGLEQLRVVCDDASVTLILDLHDLRCGAGLVLCGTQFDGELCGTNARIEGVLDLGSFKRQEGGWEQTIIGGKIDFDQVTVGSRINLSGARLYRITLDQSQVRGTIFCEIDHVSGHPVELTARDEAVLWLHGATIEGNLQIRGAKLAGWLNLSNARVRGNLVLEPHGAADQSVPTTLGASEDDRESLRLVGTSVEGTTQILDVEFAGSLNAANASFATLSINKGSRMSLEQRRKEAGADWYPLKLTCGFKELLLDEPALREPSGDKLAHPSAEPPKDRVHEYEQLLNLTKFDEGTYMRLEGSLRQQGKDEDADAVFLHMRRRESSLPNRGIRRWRDRVFLLVAGYGVKPWRLFFGWLSLFTLTGLVFIGPESVENEKGEHPLVWDMWDSAWLSLRLQVPVIDIFARDDWKPAAQVVDFWEPWISCRYDSYASIIVIVSWITVPVLLAAVAGLLKRRS